MISRLNVERERRRKRKKRIRALILVLEVIILLALGVVAFAMRKLDLMDKVNIESVITNETLNDEDYTNIALFGIDAREGETIGVRSDTIIIASLDNVNKNLRLVSVYRDSFLRLEGTEGPYYAKANDAYAIGGPQEAVNMLNRNLDLNIQDYVTVNFGSMSDIVDLLGGIEIGMMREEVIHMNNYCVETSEVTGKEYEPIEPPEVMGTYNLNGVQAVSYARIRATDGGDFKRTERQRLILEKIMEKAKQTNIFQLNKIANKVLPEVSTSLDIKTILKIGEALLNYEMLDSTGFPYETALPSEIPGYSGSYVVPVNLLNNVTQLHNSLFPDVEYVPSDMLNLISGDIIYLTGIATLEDAYY
ncbi:LCP family protein [Ohessyouella blattaphilus]|uniref:LCP family protein n=1 Tax=Ohessyouella blattaphilus TaxID=2949333 RepID=A0ABT1EG58_9FIRM|nr:LCP family protein [Ohessyouella blattaphilus]MCP1108661.1 LCP family protein [Ohessyouella blattaphilus]MCR8562055.1 LCP family protein [Ohessyouella blattaphilus]